MSSRSPSPAVRVSRSWRQHSPDHRNVFFYRFISTPVGRIYIAGSSRGARRIALRPGKGRAILDELDKSTREQYRPGGKHVDALAVELQQYFEGRLQMFRTPLDLRSLTPFQQSVLQETRKIPYGSVITYGDIAGKIGNPGAFRAVGTALGCNPIPILIPCHRVVASGGKIGGFTGGLALKEKLLLIEGFDPETLKHPKDRTR